MNEIKSENGVGPAGGGAQSGRETICGEVPTEKSTLEDNGMQKPAEAATPSNLRVDSLVAVTRWVLRDLRSLGLMIHNAKSAYDRANNIIFCRNIRRQLKEANALAKVLKRGNKHSKFVARLILDILQNKLPINQCPVPVPPDAFAKLMREIGLVVDSSDNTGTQREGMEKRA